MTHAGVALLRSSTRRRWEAWMSFACAQHARYLDAARPLLDRDRAVIEQWRTAEGLALRGLPHTPSEPLAIGAEAKALHARAIAWTAARADLDVIRSGIHDSGVDEEAAYRGSGDFLQDLIEHDLMELGGQELLDQAHDDAGRYVDEAWPWDGRGDEPSERISAYIGVLWQYGEQWRIDHAATQESSSL